MPTRAATVEITGKEPAATSPAASRPRPPRNAIQLRRLHRRGSSPADRCTATKIASSALGLCCGVVFEQSDYAAHHGLPTQSAWTRKPRGRDGGRVDPAVTKLS